MFPISISRIVRAAGMTAMITTTTLAAVGPVPPATTITTTTTTDDIATSATTAVGRGSSSSCVTGSPVVTAGYTISYAPATPTPGAFANGYQPEPEWSGEHLVGTYTFGVPPPLESGFAYAQFKCQYYCNHGPGSTGGFYVRYAGARSRIGSYCSCFDELLDPQGFVESNQTLVGAWNPICRM